MSHVDLSWYEQHENTNFPFTDASTLRISTDGLSIPQNAITDAMVLAPSANTPVHLAKITRGAQDITFTFNQGNTAIGIAVVTLSDDDWIDVKDPSTGVSVGRMRINSNEFAALFGLPIRSFNLLASAAVLVPYATAYRPRVGVRGIKLQDGTTLTGDIYIIAGRGLRFVGNRLDVVGSPFKGRNDDDPIRRPITTFEVTDTLSAVGILPVMGNIAFRLTTSPSKPAVQISNSDDSEIRIEVAG